MPSIVASVFCPCAGLVPPVLKEVAICWDRLSLTALSPPFPLGSSRRLKTPGEKLPVFPFVLNTNILPPVGLKLEASPVPPPTGSEGLHNIIAVGRVVPPPPLGPTAASSLAIGFAF